MQLTRCIRKGLHERPRATALVCGDRRVDFGQLADRVARLAAVLRASGLEAGDRVALLAQNSDRYIEYLYATWWAGGVINPVNARWTAREIAYSLEDSGTRLLLTDRHFSAMAQQLPPLASGPIQRLYFDDGACPDQWVDVETRMRATQPIPDAGRRGDDLAAIMYTGGTTGLPKGVMLTHANLYVSQLSTLMASERGPGAIGINTAPLFHVGGVGLALQLMLRLCTQIVMPVFDEVALMRSIQDERATETFLVPTMLKRVIEHPRFREFDLGSLRSIVYGAAPIDDTLLQQALSALPHTRFCQLYGMTELSPVITVLPASDHAADSPPQLRRSAGRPVPIAEVCILDAQGNQAATDEVGEIAARGPMVMAGYWNKPEQTAAVLRDGWMHTGDGGYIDADGYVYVVDRLKDMVVSGGENIYSAEVENAITQLAQVSMCAVVGVPDAQWGERVHAVIVLRPQAELTEAQVIAHCRSEMAGYKCPRSVEFRSELPLSPAGKLLKYQIRDGYWQGQARRVN